MSRKFSRDTFQTRGNIATRVVRFRSPVRQVHYPVYSPSGIVEVVPTVSAAPCVSVPATVTVPQVTASIPPVSVTVTAPPDPIYQILIVAGDRQAADPHEKLPVNPRVQVVDQFNQPAAGVTVDWSTGGTSASVTTQTLTDSSGYTEVEYEVGADSGANNLRADISGTSGPNLLFQIYIPDNKFYFSAASGEGTSGGPTDYRFYYTPSQGVKTWTTADRSVTPYIQKPAGYSFSAAISAYAWDLSDTSAFPELESLEGVYDVAVVALDSVGNFSPFANAEDMYFYFGAGPGGVGSVSVAAGEININQGSPDAQLFVEATASVTLSGAYSLYMHDFAGTSAGMYSNTGVDMGADATSWTFAAYTKFDVLTSGNQEYFRVWRSASAALADYPLRGRVSPRFKMLTDKASELQHVWSEDSATHHVMYTYQSGGELRLFIDGTVADTTAAGSGLTFGASARFGVAAINAPVNYNLGDVGFWAGVVATSAQVSSIYNEGTPINPGEAGVNYGLGSAVFFLGGSMTSTDWRAGSAQGAVSSWTYVSQV